MFELVVPGAFLYALIISLTALCSWLLLGHYLTGKHTTFLLFSLVVAICVGVFLLVRQNLSLYLSLAAVVLVFLWSRSFVFAMDVEPVTAKAMWQLAATATLLLVVGGIVIHSDSYRIVILYWRAVILLSFAWLVWRFVGASVARSNIYLFSVGCGFAIFSGIFAASTFLNWDSLASPRAVLPSIPSWFWFAASAIWIFLLFTILRYLFEIHRDKTTIQAVPALNASHQFQLPKQVLTMDRQRALGMLASSLQHELRQPLAAMLMNAQLMLRNLKKEHVNTRILEMCLPELKHELGRFQDQIDAIRRFVGSSEVDAIAAHHIKDIVDPLLQFLAPELSRSEIDLTVDVEPNLKIWTSKVVLSQALLHLMLNALESAVAASSIRGYASISLKAKSDDENLFISVEDSGFGMRPDQIKIAGQEMFSTKSERMGLGLLIVWQYVNEQGGRWSFDAAPDHFTVVLTLPVKS